jgi:hypothetical protein
MGRRWRRLRCRSAGVWEMHEMVEIGQSGQSVTLTTEGTPATPRRGADLRQDERYVVHGDAEIFVTGGTSMFRGRILNISASGCYVQTVAWVRPAPGTLVELVFVVKGDVVRARAEARYSESKIGLGLRFVAMEEQMQRRLDRVLAGLCGPVEEKDGSGRADRSVLLTETAAARADGVLKADATEAVDQHGFTEQPAELPKEKQQTQEMERRMVDEADFSELEELGLAPEGTLRDADADAIAAMEDMAAAAGGTGLETARVRGSVIEGVIEGGRDRAATGPQPGARR